MANLTHKLARLRALTWPEKRLLLAAWLLLPLFWLGLRIMGLQRFQAMLDRSPAPVAPRDAENTGLNAGRATSLPLPTSPAGGGGTHPPPRERGRRLLSPRKRGGQGRGGPRQPVPQAHASRE
jgi:hypothetical protein